MNLREQMESIYGNTPLEDIPWNLETPPSLFVAAVESREIAPCRAVDLGCGVGNYAIWLARRGFDMTGLDFSRKAIQHARARAALENINCRFEVADLLDDPAAEFKDAFDFAYDWELLHHIFPEDRLCFIENVQTLLRPGGQYFSVCFSEEDAEFGGKGKYRKTPLGTTIYFSSEAELTALFKPYFEILELSTESIAGKRGPHRAIVAWLKRI